MYKLFKFPLGNFYVRKVGLFRMQGNTTGADNVLDLGRITRKICIPRLASRVYIQIKSL